MLRFHPISWPTTIDFRPRMYHFSSRPGFYRNDFSLPPLRLARILISETRSIANARAQFLNQFMEEKQKNSRARQSRLCRQPLSPTTSSLSNLYNTRSPFFQTENANCKNKGNKILNNIVHNPSRQEIYANNIGPDEKGRQPSRQPGVVCGGGFLSVD